MQFDADAISDGAQKTVFKILYYVFVGIHRPYIDCSCVQLLAFLLIMCFILSSQHAEEMQNIIVKISYYMVYLYTAVF